MSKVKLFIVALVTAMSAAKAQNMQSILFVCEHGAARSVIAAAYFNQLAKERGLNYRAQFRGTDPQDSLTSGTKAGLTKDGFDVSKMRPLLVSNGDVNNAERVITFDCKLPNDIQPKELSQWNGVPAISENYNVARDQIVTKVKALVDQLLKKK
jgi:protein-tyrosine-phosphatase